MKSLPREREPGLPTDAPTPGERLVEARVRAALKTTTPEADVYANVHWLAPTRPGGPPRDGETDLLVVHPEFGLLAIEVKDGTVARDASGHWFAGNRPLPESPFHQAMVGTHAIGDVIVADPRWGGRPEPRMLHAVAFPDTDRDSLGAQTLGPDAPIELVIDRADLTDETTTAKALARIFRYWSGDGARDRPLNEQDRATIREILEPTIQLRSLLRGDIEAGERALLTPTQHQLDVLRILRRERRASIEGGAGSGKTLVAIEKARQLASEGYKTLFVCFNQPLARAVADEPDLAPFIGAGMLTVTTFHELCLRLGTEAHTLPPKPEPPDQAWWDVALPHALADATKTIGGRWHALVIDEGQDFAADWLVTLQLLLDDPEHDVLYVFHDPAQALYRPDVSGDLGLHEYPLDLNCRNPGAIHAFAYRWYTGDLHSEPMREEGRAPVIIEAAAGEATVEAVGQVLRDIVHARRCQRSRSPSCSAGRCAPARSGTTAASRAGSTFGTPTRPPGRASRLALRSTRCRLSRAARSCATPSAASRASTGRSSSLRSWIPMTSVWASCCTSAPHAPGNTWSSSCRPSWRRNSFDPDDFDRISGEALGLLGRTSIRGVHDPLSGHWIRRAALYMVLTDVYSST